jgi:septum formation protein
MVSRPHHLLDRRSTSKILPAINNAAINPGGCVRILPVKLILASNSPRRRLLLALTGWEFDVHPADIDESLLPAEHPGDYVLRLAQGKAREVASMIGGSEVILAADTTVVDADAILGKPANAEEAASMLRGLRGHTHQVYTGLALCRSHPKALLTDLCITEVPMRAYTDEELQAYVDSGDPLDKAGAYAIQHPDFQPVDKLSGCFAGVMGLPLCHLERSLRKLGLSPHVDIPTQCQAALEYDCPVWRAILMEGLLG